MANGKMQCLDVDRKCPDARSWIECDPMLSPKNEMKIGAKNRYLRCGVVVSVTVP
jgi:hypothetical protein